MIDLTRRLLTREEVASAAEAATALANARAENGALEIRGDDIEPVLFYANA